MKDHIRVYVYPTDDEAKPGMHVIANSFDVRVEGAAGPVA